MPYADVVELVLIDLDVFDVDMKDSIIEFMNRAMSIICHIKLLGSILMSSESLGIMSKTCLQIFGLVIRFWPSGH